MKPVVETRDGGSLAFCPPLGLFFKNTFLEFHMYHTHFYSEIKYLNTPLDCVYKSNQTFSFEWFCTILKMYLSLREGAISVELDIHEVCHYIDIQDGQYVNIVRDWDHITLVFVPIGLASW